MEAQVIEMRMPHKEVERAVKSIADEVADRIYHEFLFLRYLPEMELVKKGGIKAMKNDEISDFITLTLCFLGNK